MDEERPAANPQIQRFIAEDRFNFNGSNSNRYQYAFNAPMILLDPVCVEFQFRRQLGSEISLCNVAARNMTQVLPLAVGARRSVEPA